MAEGRGLLRRWVLPVLRTQRGNIRGQNLPWNRRTKEAMKAPWPEQVVIAPLCWRARSIWKGAQRVAWCFQVDSGKGGALVSPAAKVSSSYFGCHGTRARVVCRRAQRKHESKRLSWGVKPPNQGGGWRLALQDTVATDHLQSAFHKLDPDTNIKTSTACRSG